MPSEGERARLQHQIITAATYFLHLVGIAAVLYQAPNYWKQQYHTSALSGQAWVEELIHGHPDRIFCELGMRFHVFMAFCSTLALFSNFQDSKGGATMEEQAAIFLYSCVTGLAARRVGQQFQHSPDTITKYFKLVLDAISPGAFYNAHGSLPNATLRPTNASR